MRNFALGMMNVIVFYGVYDVDDAVTAAAYGCMYCVYVRAEHLYINASMYK